MLIAQGLGEYGSLSGGGFSGIANLFENAEYAILDGGPVTWAALFFGVFVVWFVFLRAR
jgi:hypothetical protein